MNKYEKALETLRITIHKNTKWNIDKSYNILKELIERATPKKPVKDYQIDTYDNWDNSISYQRKDLRCPNKECNRVISGDTDYIDLKEYNNCAYCGQALEWSE